MLKNDIVIYNGRRFTITRFVTMRLVLLANKNSSYRSNLLYEMKIRQGMHFYPHSKWFLTASITEYDIEESLQITHH